MKPTRTIIMTVAIAALGLLAGHRAAAAPAASAATQIGAIPQSAAVGPEDFQLVRGGHGGRGGGFMMRGRGGFRGFMRYGGGPRGFVGPRGFGPRYITRYGGGFTTFRGRPGRYYGRHFHGRRFYGGFYGYGYPYWWGGVALAAPYYYYDYGYNGDSCYWNCRAYYGPGYCSYNAWRFC